MRTPTPEQELVLLNAGRVRVVCATPGSGKTWLVAELIRRELALWIANTSGVAALSFTRVGGDEIRKAIFFELGHPHFVGTIDSFLFRYVVRPFLRLCFPSFSNPRLVPGEWGAEHWKSYGQNQTALVGGSRSINLFGCVWVAEDQGMSVAAYKPHPTQPLKRLNSTDMIQVAKEKEKIWQRTGQLTHSDVALLASRVLNHPVFGAAVRAEIVRRFPLLIVDELQDTGYFLGKSLRLILGESAVRGVLVGDPDQAIYEFNGAQPDQFGTFQALPGAQTLFLANSLRCPEAVCRVAAHLKDSGGTVGAAQNRIGRALLIHSDNMLEDIRRLVKTIPRSVNRSKVKIIARGRTTVDYLTGRNSKNPKSLFCPPLTHVHRAVVAFRQGRNTKALGAIRAAIDLAVFGHEGVADEQLVESKIQIGHWKVLSVNCLLAANYIANVGNLFEWQSEAGKTLDKELLSFGLDESFGFTAGKLKPQKRSSWDEPVSNFMPQVDPLGPRLGEWPVQTVHSVKGETHHVTVFVCPTTNQTSHCPSVVWWSADVSDREEKRIAYVAMTRTNGDLIWFVSENTYQRLCNARKPFVDGFECMTVDDFVASCEILPRN